MRALISQHAAIIYPAVWTRHHPEMTYGRGSSGSGVHNEDRNKMQAPFVLVSCKPPSLSFKVSNVAIFLTKNIFSLFFLAIMQSMKRRGFD